MGGPITSRRLSVSDFYPPALVGDFLFIAWRLPVITTFCAFCACGRITFSSWKKKNTKCPPRSHLVGLLNSVLGHPSVLGGPAHLGGLLRSCPRQSGRRGRITSPHHHPHPHCHCQVHLHLPQCHPRISVSSSTRWSRWQVLFSTW